MRATLLTLLFFHLIGVVASCGQPGYEPIGPVTDGDGRTGGILVDLTASTNCAEVGDEMTFRVHIQNPESTAIVITKQPTLQLRIVRLSGGSRPVEKELQRLEFPYPADFQLTFQPGETRTFLWKWVVESPPSDVAEPYTINLRTQTAMTYFYNEASSLTLEPSVITGIGQIGLEGSVTGVISCSDLNKTATPSS